jgi:hypothetical protein
MAITVECMFSADLMVDDPVRTANLLVDRLGLPPLRPTWTDSSIDHLIYLRAAHPFSVAAPTLIEIIQPSSSLPALTGQAERRPVKTHATVFVTKTFPEVVANLNKKGLRHFDMPASGDGLARCFLGIESLESGTLQNEYDPAVDASLFVEIISWEGTALSTRKTIQQELSDDSVTRVVARCYLIPDIDQALHRLGEILHWDEARKKPLEGASGRYTSLQPLISTSAALELLEPRGIASRYGEFFSKWGVGPHAIRFGVRSLEAKEKDLRSRRTGFSYSETPAGQPVLLVDESALDGIIVEFVEDPLTV